MEFCRSFSGAIPSNPFPHLKEESEKSGITQMRFSPPENPRPKKFLQKNYMSYEIRSVGCRFSTTCSKNNRSELKTLDPTAHLPARYAQTRLAPSPCFSLTTEPIPPSAPLSKCKEQGLPQRVCVREMFEVYDSPIRQAQKVHEQC